MAELYDSSGQVGKIFGQGNPTKVYADSVTVTSGDTITIPGATSIVSATVSPASSSATVATSGGVVTITIASGTPVCQVLVLYN
jgi:hypothetical protein